MLRKYQKYFISLEIEVPFNLSAEYWFPAVVKQHTLRD